MLAQFKFEWALFTRNVKNRILFIVFVVVALYFGLMVAPEFQPLYPFADEDIIHERIEEQEYIIGTYEDERPLTVNSARNIINISQQQLEALNDESWGAYFEQTRMVNSEIRRARYGNSVDPRFFDINEPFPELEESFWRGYTNTRYGCYASEAFDGVTPEIVEERTVLQTIQRLMQDYLQLILLILLVLYSVDSLTKNKGHRTVFNSTPLYFGKVLWIKTIVVLFGFLLTLAAGFLALLVTIGPRFGVGALSIPVPTYSFDLYGGLYETLPMGHWLLQALILIVISSLVLIRGILLLSVLFKQEFLNLLLGISVLFTESLYYSRGVGYFRDIGLLPPTFFSVGSVLIGYHNFLYNSRDIHFLNGVLSLGAAWLGMEVLLFVVTRFKRFRRM